LSKTLWRFGRRDGRAYVRARAVRAVDWVFGKGQWVVLMAGLDSECGGDRHAVAAVLAKSSSVVASGHGRVAGKFGATSRQGGDHGHEVSILIAAALDADGG
jgi:hypothetical protein